MKILILGGHGFIGHHVARQLIDLGHEIGILDIHHTYGDYQEWEYNPVLKQRLLHLGNHKFWLGDVCDKEVVEKIFKEFRPQRVIDLATYPNAKMVKKNIIDATNNMITATVIALDMCAKYSVERFVLASSSMVYGDFDSFKDAPNENSICNPLTLYGSYKLQCERMCRIWQKEYGIEYTLLRPSALYGIRDMVVRVISKMTVSALKTGKIIVNGPNNKLDFTYVTDVANAFTTAVLHNNASNQIFNCTRGNGRKIIEAAEIIKSIIPSEIVVEPHDSFYPNRDTLNSNLMIEMTGWKPIIDIEKGIPLYLNWFLKQNYIDFFKK
jgi:nucleoside-diphosphate-sugar epimerase